MHLAHPRRVALSEIVVDGDDVHPLARERIEIGRQGGDEGLAFAGAHLRDPALMQRDAAHELHEEGTHPEHSRRRFSHDAESLREDVVERRARGEPLLEDARLRGEVVVAHE